MAQFVPCLDPPPLSSEDGRQSPSLVLLDDRAYISATAVSNTTTAFGCMSSGKPVEVSFCVARPPRLSYLCVHFSGPVAGPTVGTIFGPAAGTAAVRCVGAAPRVVSTHSDLALICVSIPGASDLRKRSAYDYFVYTARLAPHTSSLYLLPRPRDYRFRSSDAAVVRCSSSRYIIASLENTCNPVEFMLQLYDTDTGSWTSRLLRVNEPERDKVLPIPDTAIWYGQLFHRTTKVIVLGGPSATVGWVDLWRGILFCNVLDEEPMLRDMPLPKPSKGNKTSFCRGCPHPYRDITVVTLPEQVVKIKYIEMETRPGDVPSQLPIDQSGSDSDPDNDGVDDNVADYWKATIWTLPLPITSWTDWHREGTLDVTDIVVDNPSHSELLLTLPRHSADPKEASWTLRRLITGHPALGLSMDGDVIYFLSKVDLRDYKGWVIAVDTRDRKLKGVAELDHRKNTSFRRYYCPTGISKYLARAAGEEGTLVRTKVRSRK